MISPQDETEGWTAAGDEETSWRLLRVVGEFQVVICDERPHGTRNRSAVATCRWLIRRIDRGIEEAGARAETAAAAELRAMEWIDTYYGASGADSPVAPEDSALPSPRALAAAARGQFCRHHPAVTVLRAAWTLSITAGEDDSSILDAPEITLPQDSRRAALHARIDQATATPGAGVAISDYVRAWCLWNGAAVFAGLEPDTIYREATDAVAGARYRYERMRRAN